MDRANSAVAQQPAPLTAAATFKITLLDIGSPAVRPGCMGAIEEERAALIVALRGALEVIYSAGELADSAQYRDASALLAKLGAE